MQRKDFNEKQMVCKTATFDSDNKNWRHSRQKKIELLLLSCAWLPLSGDGR